MFARKQIATAALAAAVAACGASSSTNQDQNQPPPPLAQAVFVGTADGKLTSLDAASGGSRAGEVLDVQGPTDLQALPEGVVGVNVTAKNAVLFVDARTMQPLSSFPSAIGASKGVRPVHAYLSPSYDGKRYWLTLNDGDGTAATNSALLVDVTKGSATWLKPVGEAPLGIGHHKAAFSRTRPRLVVSNIADPSQVFQILDFSDPAHLQQVKSFSAADLGLAAAAPHGCASSIDNKRAYCNLTATGQIASIPLDDADPVITLIDTAGKGSGATAVDPSGRWIFAAHNTPNAAAGGSPNQIGSVSVIDVRGNGGVGAVVAELPLLYDGGGATAALAADESLANVSHLIVAADGKTLFASPGTDKATAAVAQPRVRRVLAVNVEDPTHPVQWESIAVGASTDHNGSTLSGDGKLLFVTNNADASVSVVDVATRTVVRTLATHGSSPKVVASFGDAEGCSKPVH